MSAFRLQNSPVANAYFYSLYDHFSLPAGCVFHYSFCLLTNSNKKTVIESMVKFVRIHSHDYVWHVKLMQLTQVIII